MEECGPEFCLLLSGQPREAKSPLKTGPTGPSMKA